MYIGIRSGCNCDRLPVMRLLGCGVGAAPILQTFDNIGDPGRTRTCYLQIRNLSLYPDELRDLWQLYSEEFGLRHPTAWIILYGAYNVFSCN